MATKLEKQIIQRMDGKRTFGQIGKEFGLGYQTIKGIADRNGIERPKSNTLSKADTSKLEVKILKALKSGVTSKGIKAKFDIKAHVINKVIKAKNFTKNERNSKIVKLALKNTTTNYTAIGRKIGISPDIVKKIILANNVKISGRCGFPMKTERNAELVSLLKEGNLTYPQLGEKFGVTKQRVYQFAKLNGISRWKLSREKHRAIAKAIEVDYKSGLSYKEIKNKYNLLNLNTDSLKRYGYKSLSKRFRNERNTKVVKEYKTKTAKLVLKSADPSFNNPERLTSVGSVYGISTRTGFKKYPKVGNRNGGGVFEKPEIIKFIKDKRDKNGLSFSEISTLMIAKGWKTPQERVYSEFNVRQKYVAIKKHNA